MSKNMYMAETFDVYTGDFGSDMKYIGTTESTEISQKMEKEPIKGGIGNPVLATIQHSKELEIKVVNALYNKDIMELQSGTKFYTKSKTIPVQQTLTAEDNAGNPEIALDIVKYTPKGNNLIIVDLKDGKEITTGVDFDDTTGLITNSMGSTVIVVGQRYRILFQEDKLAEIIDVENDKFPENTKLVLHSIVKDAETNAVAYDVYYMAEKALPDGNWTHVGKAGENSPQEMTFTIQGSEGVNTLIQILYVPRA